MPPPLEGALTVSRATQHAYSFKPRTPFKVNGLKAGHAALLDGMSSFFRTFRHFGISDVHEELRHKRTMDDVYDSGAQHVHFSQVYKDVPVYGTYLKVHTTGDSISYVNGAFIPDIDVITIPTINQTAAISTALQATYSTHKHVLTDNDVISDLEVASIALCVYHTGITRDIEGDVLLAYHVVVVHKDTRKLIKENVFVDAHDGQVVHRFSAIPSAMYREVWRTSYQTGPQVYKEGDATPTAADAANIVKFSKLAYELYMNMIGFDSFNNKGAKMIGVYDLPPNSRSAGCPVNAFWNGQTVNFCPNLAKTDVSLHEWTHAYTEYTHALIYEHEPGALNEAYSDIVAESVQIIFGLPAAYAKRPNDDCVELLSGFGLRWIVGDELSTFSSNFPRGLRDMYNPNCGDNPRTTSDPLIVVDPDLDNGGVHYNSGIPNQAFSLLTDGGNFLGIDVKGIGINKALSIYLRAMTYHQGETTNFRSHAQALTMSCSELEGQNLRDPKTGGKSSDVISEEDCEQLDNALQAVGMSTPLPLNGAPPPVPSIVKAYPSVGPISTGGISSAFVLIAPNLLTSKIYCRFEGQLAGQSVVNGTVVTTESHSGAFCPLPPTFDTPQQGQLDISADGQTFSPQVFVFEIFADPVFTDIQPTSADSDSLTEITIKGNNFQEYIDCTPYPSRDANGDRYDCLVCVFGSLEEEFPVRAQLVAPDTIVCKLPPKKVLVNSMSAVPLSVSMNNLVFYPELVYIQYTGDSTIGIGGAVAAVILPLLLAMVVASAVAALFVGKFPGKLGAYLSEQWASVKNERRTTTAELKFMHLFPFLVILYLLSIIWVGVLTAETSATFARTSLVFVIIMSVFTIMGFVAVKSGRSMLTFVYMLVMAVLLSPHIVCIGLLGSLVHHYKSHDGEVVLSAASTVAFIALLPANVLAVLYAYRIYKEPNVVAFDAGDRSAHINYLVVSDEEV